MVKNRTIYRVLPDRGKWKVTRNRVALRWFELKADAIKYARREAKRNTPSQVVVHKQDGTIAEEWTYEYDPYPPVG